ncbi:MAG TPA: SIS domain-containing protein [Candidatus Sulfotelmatobacter sp.]|nr:SIS domain-containing protein [Candidatus Sulfotelmatobacter sp.]
MKRRRAERSPLEAQARGWLRDAVATLRRTEQECAPAVAEAAEAIIGCLETGGTVFFCGNGGSAADSQHLATEFAGRFQTDRAALAAVALTTNSSALTAIGNDYGYSHVFSRQLEGLGTPGDVLIAISTSGGAESVRRAVATARRLGMTTIAMTGTKGRAFADSCDIALMTPHDVTSHVQEGHIAMGHALCLLVEAAIFPASGIPAAKRRAAPRRGARPRRRRSAR